MTTESARNWEALARAVKARRIEVGFSSQKEAADAAGFSLNTWGRLENGTGVSIESLDAAAKALQWEPSTPAAILHGLTREASPARGHWDRVLHDLPRSGLGASRRRSPPIPLAIPAFDHLNECQELPGTHLYMQETPEVPDWVFLSVVVPIPSTVAAYLSHEDVAQAQELARTQARGFLQQIAKRSWDRAHHLFSEEIRQRHESGESTEEISAKVGLPVEAVSEVLGQ